MIAAGDALSELAQLVAIQELAQLRLADQNDLQQLVGRRLQIGEQAHLLEHVGGKILRLIDDDDDAPALGVRGEKPAIQRIHHLLDAVAVGFVEPDTELLADGEQELRVAVTRGFRITATSAWCGTRESSVRTTVVLPVPTSPVSWMKPPASLMP